ncbi:MAG: benzoyl-CoA-dihydrodiol lyase [Planctomycetota bacterium]|nr:MAG: benzoyl-CoA-dihydrodiol lyase [Planctomycetota bacterium]
MNKDLISFQPQPDRYIHFRLEIRPPIARIQLNVQEEKGVRSDYKLKLNSYDIGVDIELADIVERLRFEHPEVSVVCIESARQDIFCAGANIYMLASSSHSHKVNFCKFTNETRLQIEEATERSGQYYVASLKGGAAGGGYELAMACAEIHLIDDRKSSVSLPEAPYLGVLPGTGGLTRLVDKRRVRRDLADIFCTLPEGARGRRALEWRLVDFVHAPSVYDTELNRRLEQLAEQHPIRAERGIELSPIQFRREGDTLDYKFVKLQIEGRRANLTIAAPPEEELEVGEDPCQRGGGWYPIELWRELRDAILQLRFNYEEVGLVCLYTEGSLESVLRLDENLHARRGHWLIKEILLLQARVLKMVDVSAKSFFSFVVPGSCFGGSLLELALASDRIYMLDEEGSAVGVSPLNGGMLLMGHGLSRLENRFYQDEEAVRRILELQGQAIPSQQAFELGLVTELMDDIDWEDEVRIAIEERLSLSPDALTGLEANLRFVGKETMESRIFGRLSAWQNWIFTRPNATGQKGALSAYGKEFSPEFDWTRT